jgi:hypothetical protein
MKKKVKWNVHKLLGKGQRRPLKMWLRYVESLRGEEEMDHRLGRVLVMIMRRDQAEISETAR